MKSPRRTMAITASVTKVKMVGDAAWQLVHQSRSSVQQGFGRCRDSRLQIDATRQKKSKKRRVAVMGSRLRDT